MKNSLPTLNRRLVSAMLIAAVPAVLPALECPVDESVDSFWPYGPGVTSETWSDGSENLLVIGSGSALEIFDV
ncbi:MAG: hypothetical protein AAFY88_32535, partial [Acidobacteriota bacterium]